MRNFKQYGEHALVEESRRRGPRGGGEGEDNKQNRVLQIKCLEPRKYNTLVMGEARFRVESSKFCQENFVPLQLMDLLRDGRLKESQ